MSAAVTMIGLTLPECGVWSPRVATALGMNPGIFTGPGTNTYLVGTGSSRILLDTGQGAPAYLPVLERAMQQAGCDTIQEIVLTHGHPDHLGGVADVRARFGPLRVSKLLLPGEAERLPFPVSALADGCTITTEGATLRGVHAPGHAEDHLCFVLEEEGALFSGDNVLGVGTTVIPAEGGDLSDYLRSLERLLACTPGRIYPAHGPCIEDGPAKLREYLAHRAQRERQIEEALGAEPRSVPALVEHIYREVPKVLHAAAAQSVGAHLLKLEREGRALRHGDAPATVALWSRP